MTSTADLFNEYEWLLHQDTVLTLQITVYRHNQSPKLLETVSDRMDGLGEIHRLHDEIVAREGSEFLELAVCLHRGGMGTTQACDAAHMLLQSR